MERTFYFTGFRLTVYHWQGKKLVGTFSFSPANNGYKKFDEYLEKTQGIPARFLIDIIEEDYKREVIPKVGGGDRTQLIERARARLFSGAKYSAVIPLGKDPENKHKEQLLFASPTNPGLMMPWINKIERWEVPLKGIWSVPLISVEVLSLLKIKSQFVLIISQQVSSTIRQTFFEHGKMVFSRQSKVKLQNREIQDASTYLQLLTDEVMETERYLTSHRVVGFSDKVTVCCFVRDELASGVKDQIQNTNISEYQVYSLNEVEQTLGYKKGSSQYADVVFARLCSRISAYKDHYSTRKETRHFDEQIINWVLSGFSVASFVLTVTLSMAMVFSGLESEKNTEEVQQLISKVNQEYQSNFAHKEEELSRASTVQSVVQLSESVIRDTNLSPIEFFLSMSRIVSKPKYFKLSLEAIEWNKQLESETKSTEPGEGGTHQGLATINEPSFNGMDSANGDFNNDVMQVDNKVHVATIKARVTAENVQHRKIVETIEEFLAELESDPMVLSVHVVKLPVDLRSSSTYSDKSGKVKSDDGGDSSNKLQFSFRVVMKGSNYV